MKNLLFILTAILCNLATSGFAQNIDQRILLDKADSLISNYQFEKAVDILAAGDGLSVDILLRRGQCYVKLGSFGDAVVSFERVLQQDSSNFIALNQLGLLYGRNSDFKRALECYHRLINLDPSNSYYCKQAGLMYSASNDLKESRAWLAKALELHPGNAEASVLLGEIFMEMEEYKSVDSVVNRALEYNPQLQTLWALKARSAFEQNKFELVIETVNRILQKSDTTVLYARLLGVSYYRLMAYRSAVDCLIFLLKNEFNPGWVYYYMGVAARAHGKIPSSVTWFRLAIDKSVSGNITTYYAQLAESCEDLGDYQGAIKAYRAAYNFSKDGIWLYQLARTYDIYYKDKSVALTYYEKYLESDDTISVARDYARNRLQDMGRF